jgi:hypothetical protein
MYQPQLIAAMKTIICSLLSYAALLITLALIATGCTSLVYSPFATLPSEPLRKDRGQLTATLSALPEASGDLGSAHAASEGMIRHAFSDRLTLQARGWSRFSSMQSLQLDGFSFEGIYMLNDTTASLRVALMPRVEFMMNGRSIDGEAAMISAVAWLPKIGFVNPYLGAGTGAAAIIVETDEVGRERVGWGYAFIGNAGATVDLFASLSVNVELAGTVQFERYNGSVGGFLLPSIGVSWMY